MTREEAIDWNECLKMYMKISDKQNPCKFREENYIALDMANEALKENESLAKSVIEASELLRKKRPHGEWIWKKDEDALRTYDLLCSECGYKTFTCENYDNVEQAKKVVEDRIREGKTLFPFCPNCGALMRQGGDST